MNQDLLLVRENINILGIFKGWVEGSYEIGFETSKVVEFEKVKKR